MRIVAITGASGGIAEQLIKQLPEEDMLLLLGRSEERLAELYKERQNKRCIGLDITDDTAVENFINQVYQEFGRIDVLINNAGYAVYKNFEAFSMTEIRDMFDVNTFAGMNFCRLVGGKMKEAKSGHIINIVSMSGYMATGQSSIYSASKFAMIGYSDTLRLELAPHGVFVTTVNPGPVATKFFDQADPSGAYLDSVKAFTLQPDVVAAKIVNILGKKKRQLNMPLALNAAHKAYTLFPTIADFLAGTVFNLKGK
ncbi:SDR family NAD(P)-dependent oxidoreductase [Streptococcus sp. S784/96/1]|uniref:SDR family NAD(P)-dependent oxidoreductase n=1 Tax=Streptococcus sp. S784/96/1 TaxID=2653499 RepID=UPI001386EBCA|nr:SDR family oxidoreductase [Streptococcus sp. S784/96/1]